MHNRDNYGRRRQSVPDTSDPKIGEVMKAFDISEKVSCTSARPKMLLSLQQDWGTESTGSLCVCGCYNFLLFAANAFRFNRSAFPRQNSPLIDRWGVSKLYRHIDTHTLRQNDPKDISVDSASCFSIGFLVQLLGKVLVRRPAFLCIARIRICRSIRSHVPCRDIYEGCRTPLKIAANFTPTQSRLGCCPGSRSSFKISRHHLSRVLSISQRAIVPFSIDSRLQHVQGSGDVDQN